MDDFERFVLARRSDLKRIARHTLGEHSLDDVVNEAWMMAHTVSARRGIPIDFGDDEFQELVIACTYQQLVRYTELNVRHAFRLDRPLHEHDADAGHPLSWTPAADGDPLSNLVDAETECAAEAVNPSSHAMALVLLLRRFDDRMRPFARHLLVSVSQAYRCRAKARDVLAHQHMLDMRHFPVNALGPWRRDRATRAPRQMAFDFPDYGLLERTSSVA